jgi:hypothetical protein
MARSPPASYFEPFDVLKVHDASGILRIVYFFVLSEISQLLRLSAVISAANAV